MHSTSSVEHGAGARSNQELTFNENNFYKAFTKRHFIFNSRILALHLSVCHSLNYKERVYLIYYTIVILSSKE